tara:strand:+ start:49 stop:873 length:825 start_codon:yes stop_codon:yes gene_type:complete
MKNVFSYLLMAGLILFAMSCSSDEDTPNGSSARVNFYLVDAPTSYDEVWVEVLAVRVKVDEDGIEDDDLDDEDDPSWVEIVYDESQPINLLELTGGNSEFLGTENFPQGEIDQIRLILGEDNYVIKNGERFEMKTPSAQQSGLKIKVDEYIEAGMSYDLIIDFDAAKSIVEAGNSGQIILKPVLRAYIDEVSTGIIGQVLPLEAQPVRVTVQGEGDVMNTAVDANGNYKITGLDDGIYTITFTPYETYSVLVLESVEVEDGMITTVDPVVLSLN